MHVGWEERVDFRRLHEYRLGRAREDMAMPSVERIVATVRKSMG
jgi:hypothetical protein